MSYGLKTEEKVRDGIARVARGQLRWALGQVRAGREDADVVHRVRRTLKRLRALLRLARRGMPAGDFAREDAAFRELGKSLSEMRDAKICICAVDSLRRDFKGRAVPSVLPQARRKLAARLRHVSAHAKKTAWRPRVAEGLRNALARVPSWTARNLTWNNLLAALQKSYGHARHAFAKVCKKPSSHNLHQWRKQVKRLGFHLRLLEPACPEVMHELAREAEVLGGHLGDEHDFVVLQEALRKDDGKLPRVDDMALAVLIRARRAQLQQAAFAVGRRFFAEKPRMFATRIADSRKLWRATGRSRTNQ